MGYARSPSPDFVICLRIRVGLDENDIHLFLKQHNSNFITYESDPGVYTIKDLQKAVHLLGDHEGTLKKEYDDVSMKTKLFETRFGSFFRTLRFDEKSFYYFIMFYTILGFTPKPTNAILADDQGVYTKEKVLNLGTIDKIHLKCDVIDGSVQIG